jgi:hypothetical protein
LYKEDTEKLLNLTGAVKLKQSTEKCKILVRKIRRKEGSFYERGRSGFTL